MDIVAIAASYAITVFSTLVCLGFLAAEVYLHIRKGERLTWYTGEFAAVIVLTVALAWIVRSIMDDPLVAQLFFGIVALWLASMIWWLYDTAKRSSYILIISELERNL
ncbi:hypothetical protein [Reticulibacter mediterranei]|nr:hypothetical protein [Reticulibacter mediterranei]